MFSMIKGAVCHPLNLVTVDRCSVYETVRVHRVFSEKEAPFAVRFRCHSFYVGELCIEMLAYVDVSVRSERRLPVCYYSV